MEYHKNIVSEEDTKKWMAAMPQQETDTVPISILQAIQMKIEAQSGFMYNHYHVVAEHKSGKKSVCAINVSTDVNLTRRNTPVPISIVQLGSTVSRIAVRRKQKHQLYVRLKPRCLLVVNTRILLSEQEKEKPTETLHYTFARLKVTDSDKTSTPVVSTPVVSNPPLVSDPFVSWTIEFRYCL